MLEYTIFLEKMAVIDIGKVCSCDGSDGATCFYIACFMSPIFDATVQMHMIKIGIYFFNTSYRFIIELVQFIELVQLIELISKLYVQTE